MKVVPISEAGPQMNQLALDALKGELVVFTVGSQELELRPRETDEEEYDPELEGKLLKALDEPSIPFSAEDIRKACSDALAASKKK